VCSSDLQREIAGIHAQRQAYIDSLVATGMSLAAATIATRAWRDAMLEAAKAAEAARLAQAESAYQDIVRGLQDELDAASMSEFALAMRDINRWTVDTEEQMHDAARAAGRQAAAEQDLAKMHEVAALRASQALARLQEQAQALAAELYGTPLSRIEDQIAALQERESAASAAIRGFGDAMTDAANAAAEAMGLLLGSYSPLRASDKLPIALDALRRGETDANTVLGIARDVYGSGRAYNEIFDQVQAIVASQSSGSGGGRESSGGGSQMSEEMRRLIAERDALQAEKDAADRFLQASQLAGMVAELAGARGEGYDVIAEMLGFTLEQFAEDLQLDGVGALTDYLSGLAEEQASIATLFDLPTAGDLAIIEAINGREQDRLVTISPVTDPIPVTVAPVPEAEERDEETAQNSREMLEMFRLLVTRGLDANEDTADAAERTVETLERVLDALAGDGGAAVAAVTGRGGA
jgi:hypothetical protein